MATTNGQIPIADTNITWVMENRYGDSDDVPGKFTSLSVSQGSFLMRAMDSGLGQQVYWTSGFLDSTGLDYSGAGPLSGIVLIRKGMVR